MAGFELRTPLVGLCLAELARRGIETASIRAAFGLAGDDGPILVTELERFAEMCAGAADDPTFGLELASRVPRGAYGLVEFLWRAAATPRDGLAQITHFAPLISLVIVPQVVSLDGGRTRIIVSNPISDHWRFVNEYIVGFYARQFRENLGGRAHVRAVSFSHPTHASAHAVASFLAVPTAFGQPGTWLEVETADLDLPHLEADSALLAAIARTLTPALKRSPQQLTFSERVRASVEASLLESQEIAMVARQLGLTPRTLQRRLAAEQSSFNDILDSARRARAGHLLSQSRMSMTDVALELGFADASAFGRAHKRWTGESPRQVRRTAPAEAKAAPKKRHSAKPR